MKSETSAQKAAKETVKTVSAFAPATVANVAVGFDILGFALPQVGDTVTLQERTDEQIVLVSVSGHPDFSELPKNPKKNLVVAILREWQKLGLSKKGFNVFLKKGIPLSSGMGGSAASIVATLVAANSFLKVPLSNEELLMLALKGEALACGTAHPDNVLPCLLGGLTLMVPTDISNGRAGKNEKQKELPFSWVNLPLPRVKCVLVHPHLRVETKAARGVLSAQVERSLVVKQQSRLAGFICACYQKNLTLLAQTFKDDWIEVQRAHLIPGFKMAKEAALMAGALGCSISGSGPSVFAWFEDDANAQQARTQMVEVFTKAGIGADSWVLPISKRGAHILS